MPVQGAVHATGIGGVRRHTASLLAIIVAVVEGDVAVGAEDAAALLTAHLALRVLVCATHLGATPITPPLTLDAAHGLAAARRGLLAGP
jgi:hypothetical protein